MKVKLRDYYKLERKLLTVFLVSSFAVTLMDLWAPNLVRVLMDDIIPARDMNRFARSSLLLGGLYILRFAVSLFSYSRGQLMGNRLKYHMRNDLYKKILDLPSKFFNKNKSGDLITRLTGDLESSSTLLYRGLEDILFSILSIIGAVFVMVGFSPALTVLTLLPLPFTSAFVWLRNERLKRGYGAIRGKNSELTSNIHDTLKTIFFIKDNLLEGYRYGKFQERNEELLEEERRNCFNISLLMSGITFYNNLTQMIIIFAGGYLYIGERITMGVILSFLLLTNRFRIYLIKLMGLVDIYQRGMTGISRFREIMNTKEEESGKNKIEDPIETLELKDLTFSHGGREVISKLNITVNKGEKIAFVGRSGVGKSTLLNLIKKALVPQEGKILINGVCLSSIDRVDYLGRLGIIDQNEHIMNESVEENITAVRRDMDIEDFNKSLERSMFHEVVEELPERESTLPGSNGIQLSSGQKQRIAAARVFLKKPEILILDEATNTLDNITEAKIMENIHSYFKDRIVVAVAHRLDTLKNFDRIYVLGEEGVIESGSFHELLRRKTIFYGMYRGG
ncbi:multidrug ABC transporter ATP-binding protein [Propionigenium maris DSM 9537]|uniref:Multidrug ABC transporter ATP-binding protein n=1 Tax=Propionigenium maris DSM 9537 TaxID=1123000 RepID=A0A9W6GLG2_9FUSO|nr:ABC transporter ATP-binding protein [Propionigenium maris]GLI57278.1 multidrug ABC transporter ATP-binding protein [Propionigenium maris DSM 9537]